MHLITKNIVKVDANYALINKVKAILEREWEVKRKHIFREATAVAEWLANFGLTKSPLNRDYWWPVYGFILDFVLWPDWVNVALINLIWALSPNS